MSLDETTLDTAYDIYDEFGPERSIDRATRLANALPSISPDEIPSLIRQMEEVSQTVWKFARLGGEEKIGKEKVIELLKAEHPFLRDRGLERAVFLVNYYAWHG